MATKKKAPTPKKKPTPPKLSAATRAMLSDPDLLDTLRQGGAEASRRIRSSEGIPAQSAALAGKLDAQRQAEPAAKPVEQPTPTKKSVKRSRGGRRKTKDEVDAIRKIAAARKKAAEAGINRADFLLDYDGGKWEVSDLVNAQSYISSRKKKLGR